MSPSAATRDLVRLLAAMPGELERFRVVCEGVGAWEEVLAQAFRQGVEGLLFRELESARVELPETARTEAARLLALRRAVQAPLQAALEEALAALEEARVETLALKGPVLSERLHGDARLRASSDLDLLVSRRDLDRAQAVLEGLGYVCDRSPTDRWEREHHHHIELRRAGTPVLELHFRLFTGLGVVLEADEFLGRSSAHRTASGRAVRVLAPEDELLYLALHAAASAFVRLLWLYDVKVAAGNPAIDHGLVRSRAGSLGVRTAVDYALETARLWLGASIPEESAAPSGRSRVAALVLGARKGEPAAPLSRLGDLAYSAALCDELSGSWRLVRERVARGTRRRVQRAFPALVPEAWSA